jgi:uncharacterized protein (TIGR03066 family)
MKTLHFASICGLILGLASFAGADTKPKPKDDKPASVDKGKLAGTWEVSDGGTAGDKGTVYEFTKDGKVTISAKKKKGVSGTYKIDGDSITWKVGIAGVAADSPPMKVGKLTDKELVFEDVGGGKTTLTKK